MTPSDKTTPDYWTGYADGYRTAVIAVARLAREHRNGATGDIDVALLVLLEAVETALRVRE